MRLFNDLLRERIVPESRQQDVDNDGHVSPGSTYIDATLYPNASVDGVSRI